MRVHHLNCGTMHPIATEGGLVCHVLLLETDHGLALVDTGLGLLDAAEPGKRFGPARIVVRPVFDPREAAITQIRQLGHDPADVRHIVITHFDSDHVGGLADFPAATVHLTGAEAFAAQHPQTFMEKQRYRPTYYAHGPALVEHTPAVGESWRGFPGAEELTDIAPGVVLISLPGHTRGHAAVAVDAGDRWVLHVGDAFYFRRQLDGRIRNPMTLMERSVAFDWAKVQANHQRLAEVLAAGEPDLLLVNAHDPALLELART